MPNRRSRIATTILAALVVASGTVISGPRPARAAIIRQGHGIPWSSTA